MIDKFIVKSCQAVGSRRFWISRFAGTLQQSWAIPLAVCYAVLPVEVEGDLVTLPGFSAEGFMP